MRCTIFEERDGKRVPVRRVDSIARAIEITEAGNTTWDVQECQGWPTDERRAAAFCWFTTHGVTTDHAAARRWIGVGPARFERLLNEYCTYALVVEYAAAVNQKAAA